MRPLRFVVFIAFAACAPSKPPTVPAAPPAARVSVLDGPWHGSLMGIAFGVRFAGATGVLDIPQQGASGVPITNVSLAGADVAFDVPDVKARLRGKLDGDSITGTMTQHGESAAFTLSRGALTTATTNQASPGEHDCTRSPTDDPAAPYQRIEVAIDSTGGARLAGTLVLPDGGKRVPAVVMVTGSGPQDRDECVDGIRAFRQLADYLARRGIASLRYDDRGVAKSTGTFSTATADDFTADALAAVKLLQTRPEIDPHKIGVLGHSEGGVIAPLAAIRDPAVAFIVLWAGPALPAPEVITLQTGEMLRAQGASAEAIDKAVANVTAVFEALRASHDNASFTAALRRAAGMLSDVTDVDEWVSAQVHDFGGAWMRWYLYYDPAATLAKIRCPVLALSGSLDTQVPPKANLPALRHALAHNRRATIRELPGLAHSFQRATTGAPSEYATLPPIVDNAVLEATASWIASI